MYVCIIVIMSQSTMANKIALLINSKSTFMEPLLRGSGRAWPVSAARELPSKSWRPWPPLLPPFSTRRSSSMELTEMKISILRFTVWKKRSICMFKSMYVLLTNNSTYAYVNIVRRRESGVTFTLAYKILGCGIEKINELICLRLFENSVNEVLHFWNDGFTTK